VAREVSAARRTADRGGWPVSGPPAGRDDRAPVKPVKPVKDDGLRRVLTWTLIALVVSLAMALVGVTLAVRWFDRP
jgi:hypothetical protein